MSIIIGRPLIEQIELCYHANVPLMVTAPHGVGKSEVFEQAARKLGIQFISLDLSLLEPSDLTGIPEIVDHRTVFATPKFLPISGKGILLLEEVNRCEDYVRAPAMQLLSARRFNTYILPDGWLPCGAINPAGPRYVVKELDGAFMSRFLCVDAVPDVEEWLYWAAKSKMVHPSIIGFARVTPNMFADATAPPRSWTYAGQILHKWGNRSGPGTDIPVS